MKALTIQQPWAWAIFNGKNIENRSQLWSHRGLLAIHAGSRLADSAMHDPRILGAVAGSPIDSRCRFWSLQGDLEPHLVYGAIIGVVEVVDCHPAAGCCAPWGDTDYVEFGGPPASTDRPPCSGKPKTSRRTYPLPRRAELVECS